VIKGNVKTIAEYKATLRGFPRQKAEKEEGEKAMEVRPNLFQKAAFLYKNCPLFAANKH